MGNQKKTGEGLRALFVRLEPDVDDAVRALAEQNGRSLQEEIAHALRRHLAAPPRLITPSLADQEDADETAPR